MGKRKDGEIDTLGQLTQLLGNANVAGMAARPGELCSLGAIKGAYVLVIKLDDAVAINLPGQRCIPLVPGTYLYVGSANGPGGIKARLTRHFKPVKKLHWHVDQLTTKTGRVSAIAVPGGNECELRKVLTNLGQFQTIIPGFGSSDCGHCSSHLLASR